MSKLIVDSKRNCYELPGGWGSLEGAAASMALEPGIYVIRIASGTFSFWGSGPKEEPIVLLWLHGGAFVNKATEVSTSAGWGCLSGYDDTYTVEVSQTTRLHALFIDSSKRDNRGQIELSILSDS